MYKSAKSNGIPVARSHSYRRAQAYINKSAIVITRNLSKTKADCFHLLKLSEECVWIKTKLFSK